MKKNLTEIAYVLDRSGSMGSMTEPAIAGFNQFLAEQRKAPGHARLTLVLFDDEYLVPCQSLPLEEIVELDTTSYVPRGMTALLDAIGRTIVQLGRQLEATPEAKRPGQVIVAIFTDGYENASSEFSLKKISKMIRHQQEKYGWEFLFLGANQDAIATAVQMGIDHDKAATVSYDHAGVMSSSSSFNRKMVAMRRRAMTGEEDLDYKAAMQSIVDEERKKNSL
jgi:hypothetical protein